MFKEVIAYVLVMFGLPLLVGSRIWFLPGLVLARTIGKSHHKLEASISAFCEGFIASVFGVLIFYWFQAKPLWMVFVLLAIVSNLQNIERQEEYLFNYCKFAGLLVGFGVALVYLPSGQPFSLI
jgi:hypothetical protein